MFEMNIQCVMLLGGICRLAHGIQLTTQSSFKRFRRTNLG